MRLIDGEHLKRWILARWEETDPTSEYPLRAIEVINQIDRESEYLNIDKAVKDAYKHGKSKGIKKGIAMSHKSGVWMYERGFAGFGKCSVCGSLWESSITQNCFCKYCPRCGAEMVDDVIKF